MTLPENDYQILKFKNSHERSEAGQGDIPLRKI